MLLKEARLAARVRHPNVVPTLDVVTSQGDVLLILEYVHGEALSSLCRIQAKHRKDHVPLDIAATIMHDVLSGLSAVHEATDEKGRLLGLVHRDISPPNIVVGADGYARILDFGIAKAIEQIEESMPNRLKGKIGYMSPEQIRGESALQSSDVFAAGVILWELLATRRLFASNNESDRMKQIVGGNYPRPSRYRSGLPKALEQVVMRALDVDPGVRYQNAREFSEALEQTLPRASARRISEWVNDLAKSTLIERAHMIAQVENWECNQDLPRTSSPLATEGVLVNVAALGRPTSIVDGSGPRPTRASAQIIAVLSAIILILTGYIALVR
jgi:serine/threonine-protein kinase